MTIDVDVPVELSGSFFIIVATDDDDAIEELGDEANNIVATPLEIQLAPFADLAVSAVSVPGQVIGDPAVADVSWTVTNDGNGPSADEYAAGFNWFFKGHNLKLTFDVSVLNGSPAQNSATGYRAGDDGVLFRTQVDAGF